MRPIRLLSLLAFALLLAGPAFAYTIYMKDGSTLIAKEKYKVTNGKAIIILPNGTESFIRLDQIDVPRTDAANKDNYGTALVIDDTKEIPVPKTETKKQQTLGDLIKNRDLQPPEGAEVRRDSRPAEPTARSKTSSGYPDLATLARKPYSRLNVAAEIQKFLLGQGIDSVEIYEGTAPGRPFLEITANSEASVFRALTVSASALLSVRDQLPGQIEALELLMVTPTRERGGQFVLTPQMAEDLAAKRVEVSAFFLQNVQF